MLWFKTGEINENLPPAEQRVLILCKVWNGSSSSSNSIHKRLECSQFNLLYLALDWSVKVFLLKRELSMRSKNVSNK